MNPFLSVIIPSFNRAQKLDKTLQHLHRQSLSQSAYEIWVVNDGSTDETQKLLEEWGQRSSILHTLHQANAGQGVARNLALKKAKGQVILFMGDDIYASDTFLEEHVHFHQNHPEDEWACLGLTEWETSVPVTPYMHWLTHGGPQFAFSRLTQGQLAEFWFFYTSNLSLKKVMLNKEQFDESFHGYGWEDIELGYRLQKKGLKLVYSPTALAHHDHPMQEDSLRGKMFAIGKNARLFQRKHSEITVVPTGFKKRLIQLAVNPLILVPLHLLKKALPALFSRIYWTLASKRYFLEGTKQI